MNILIATNSNYFMPTIVMLESLIYNNPCEITIYLLYSDLSGNEIDNLLRFIDKKKNVTIITIKVSESMFEGAPLYLHLTKETYYRLLAQSILPQELERILYLDVDMIINKSIIDFYNQDFFYDGKEKLYVVCEGLGVSLKDKKIYDNLNIPYDKKYFNAGVLLMNLRLIREKVSKTLIFDYIRNNSDKLYYQDQDILNALFYDDVKYADYRIFNQSILNIKNKDQELETLNNSAIIHYAGSEKPWQYTYLSWLCGLFWKYARKTEYSGCYIGFAIKRKKYIWKRRLKRLLF